MRFSPFNSQTVDFRAVGALYHAASAPLPAQLRRIDEASSPRLFESRPRSSLGREVVVPLDGSYHAEHALPWALGMAELFGVPLRLVHLHAPMDPGFYGRRLQPYNEVDRLLREPAEKYLTDMARRLARETTTAVTPHLCEGRRGADPHSAMVNELEGHAVMWVVATRGRRRWSRFLSGSLSETLLEQTATPLLHVRGYSRPVDLAARPRIRRVVAAVDGTLGAESILEPLSKLTRLTDSECTLLRVVEASVRSPLGASVGTLRDSAGSELGPLSELGELAAVWRSKLPRLRTSVVWGAASPSRAILQQARQCNADLIALSTRRRRRLKRLLQPGVYDFLVRRSDIPLLVRRQPEEGQVD